MAENEPVKRAPRVPFLSLIDPALLDELGKVKGVPEGYDQGAHLALKRMDFAQDADFHDWRAGMLDMAAARKQAEAAHHRGVANELRKYGSPAQRKAVQQFEKHVRTLKELRSTLALSGVTVSIEDLLADDG